VWIEKEFVSDVSNIKYTHLSSGAYNYFRIDNSAGEEMEVLVRGEFDVDEEVREQ
jgi:hypothetical protein